GLELRPHCDAADGVARGVCERTAQPVGLTEPEVCSGQGCEQFDVQRLDCRRLGAAVDRFFERVADGCQVGQIQVGGLDRVGELCNRRADLLEGDLGAFLVAEAAQGGQVVVAGGG